MQRTLRYPIKRLENEPLISSARYYVNSYDDLVHTINELSASSEGGELLFRGQKNSNWGVLSSLLVNCKRNGHKFNPISQSNKMIKYFVRSGKYIVPDGFDTWTELKKITYIQHVISGTMFIDFSTNWVFPVLCAIQNTNNTSCDGALFVLGKDNIIPFTDQYDVSLNDFCTTAHQFSLLKSESLFSVILPKFCENIKKQNGVFVYSPLGYVLNADAMIIISKTAKKDITNRLSSQGYTYDGFCSHKESPIINGIKKENVKYTCHEKIKFYMAKAYGDAISKKEIYNKNIKDALRDSYRYFSKDPYASAIVSSEVAAYFHVFGEYKKACLHYSHGISKFCKMDEEQLWSKEIALQFSKLNSNFAASCCKADYLELSKKAYENALLIKERFSADDDASLAALYNAYGVLLRTLCLYDEAQDYYSRALKIKEKVYGKKHYLTGYTYHNLAKLYSAISCHKLAKKFFILALKCMIETFEEEHHETASILNAIGIFYTDIGEYDLAMDITKRVLKIRREVLGGNHPDTITTINDIGSVYFCIKNFKMALKFHEQALKKRKEKFGFYHTDVANSYNAISLDYRYLSDYDNAMESILCAKKIVDDIYKGYHTTKVTIYANYANQLLNQGDYEASIKYYQIAIKNHEHILKTPTYELACAYNGLGLAYFRMSKNNILVAKQFVKRGYDIVINVFGKNHKKTVPFKNNYRAIQAQSEVVRLKRNLNG